MYLTGLAHRDELFGIALRWLNNDLREDDGKRLTQIFLYESLLSAPVVQEWALRFLQKLWGNDITVKKVISKDELRTELLAGDPPHTPRTLALAQQYREHSEGFFPGMPVEAVLVHAPGTRLVALGRIKRPQRIAEKASHRMADALAHKIRKEAEVFANIRAASSGIALHQLISSEEQMRKDFVAAEGIVANNLRDGRIGLSESQLTINDVIGFKLIGDHAELARVEMMLQSDPDVRVAEREEHRGRYNATNLLIDIDLPPANEHAARAEAADWSVAARRGLDPEIARHDFPTFVETAAKSVRTELILTTFPELIESEFGRSLHELRIQRLRAQQAYAGQIAQNARYLIEYLFAVAYAPTIRVSSLPIKMWGRYLPDTVLCAIGTLFGMEESRVFRRFLSF